MTTDEPPFLMTVPLLDRPMAPPPRERVRALKRHLIQSLRDLRVSRRPERLIQARTPEPEGFSAQVLNAGCATCRGHCCMGGGEHGYIDERTMARVRRDRPELDAAAVISLYLRRVAPTSTQGSCLFHGPEGCTLGRDLRAELCNQFYCDGLRAFLRRTPEPDRVQVRASRDGQERWSPILTRGDKRAAQP
jgi:hypothetical protein